MNIILLMIDSNYHYMYTIYILILKYENFILLFFILN